MMISLFEPLIPVILGRVWESLFAGAKYFGSMGGLSTCGSSSFAGVGKCAAEKNVLPGWRLMSPGSNGCPRGGAHAFFS